MITYKVGNITFTDHDCVNAYDWAVDPSSWRPVLLTDDGTLGPLAVCFVPYKGEGDTFAADLADAVEIAIEGNKMEHLRIDDGVKDGKPLEEAESPFFSSDGDIYETAGIQMYYLPWPRQVSYCATLQQMEQEWEG